ncbi:MAG: glycosyltransferase family 9 protein [Legionella sp.]
MTNDIQSICIVRLSALGDVLMSVPLVRTLQQNLPSAKITWIISRPAYDLVEGMDGIEFIVIEKPRSIADYWRFKQQLKSRTFDVLLEIQASFRSNLLYPLIKAKRKIGFDLLRATDLQRWMSTERIAPGRDHTLESFLKFASALNIKEHVIRWDLPIQEQDYRWADEHIPQGRFLVVNAAASKPERNWPLASYIDALKQASARWNLAVVLVGGPGSYDRLLADQLIQALPAIDLVGKTKPKQLLAVISKAAVVLCPDTGPSHMAAACNTPVVALHAVTNPFVSGPYTFQHLVANRFPDAVKQVLGLEYQQHVWGTHVHGDKAMTLITVAEVMDKLAQVFEPELNHNA